MGKAKGLWAARKLLMRQKKNRWIEKDYRRRHSDRAWHYDAFIGASHASGIVVGRRAVEAKQPNSAVRKCVIVQLKKNGKKVSAFCPYDGTLNYVDDHDEVLICGIGRRGHAVGDIPGVRYQVVKVVGIGLMALYRGKKEKPKK